MFYKFKLIEHISRVMMVINYGLVHNFIRIDKYLLHHASKMRLIESGYLLQLRSKKRYIYLQCAWILRFISQEKFIIEKYSTKVKYF